MSRFGKQLTPDDAPALPLWVDGHALLMMAEQFLDVQDATGNVLRRVPLYGEEAVAIAAASTQKAVPVWQAMTDAQRQACFAELQALLQRYGAHLAKLLVAEAGMPADLAEAELAQTAAAVGAAPAAQGPRSTTAITVVLGDAQAPLAGPLACAVDALAAGCGVVLKPSPKAPSALFACAELFSRAGFPPGLVNCVHGDEKAVRALSAHPSLGAVAFCGDGELSRRIGEIVRADGKAFAGGRPGATLQSDWLRCLGAGQ
jgi:acyl-CoA reductase-like NAD-dependent aldehyde dehydrogenase